MMMGASVDHNLLHCDFLKYITRAFLSFSSHIAIQFNPLTPGNYNLWLMKLKRSHASKGGRRGYDAAKARAMGRLEVACCMQMNKSKCRF